MTITLEQLPFDPDNLFGKPLVEITQSSLSTFLACPQKFVFRYLMFLDTVKLSMPLLTGSAVHKGLEVFLDPEDVTPMENRVDKAIKDALSVFDKAEERTDLLPVGMDDKLDVGRATACALLEAWYILYSSDFERWKILHKEMKVRSEPDATIHSPLEDRMAGMIDGIIQDEEGKVWILEHKTRSTFHGFSVAGLELDTQALWYMILCKHVLKKKFGAGINPLGFMYDGMVKPQHRLNSNGWRDLKERMKNALLESPEKYFVVQPIPMDEATVTLAREHFARIVKAMDSLTAATVYRNTRACADYGGCPYVPLCKDGADVSRPAEVLQLPAIAQFQFRGLHSELTEDLVKSEDLEKWSPS